ncbi:putative protein [Ustilago sp. UG-2017a]|nr:putative protein [Ustilago sp. UG-2017a]
MFPIATPPALRSIAPVHLTRTISIRCLSRAGPRCNASQPATSTNPQAARVAAVKRNNNASDGDARSRLAKLQAQRLEELNRGRSGRGAGRPNRPEQKWSNRTLIALATSVGACMYLMGTYHGYNAGKQHALEASDSGPGIDVPVVPLASWLNGGASRSASLPVSSLWHSLMSMLPLGMFGKPVLCEPESRAKAMSSGCRLAELTQHYCDFHMNRAVCHPIDRIFRICKGRPAVEVSHIVEFDEQGKPYLPPHLSEAMPPSSHWHELRSSDL